MKARPLSQIERVRVFELEKEYNKVEVKGLGKPYSEGVFECLRRRYVIAMLTNEEFKWPKGPYALIKLSGEVIAEIREHGFKVFKERLINIRRKGQREYIITFPPLSPPNIEPFNRLQDAILASPSFRVHKYLLKLFNVKDNPNLGTMLLGFNEFN